MAGPDAALEAVSMQRSTRSRVDVALVAPLALALALSFLGTGCGPDTPLPSVTITAPADGAVVTGSRMVTVSGTFAHATEVAVAVGDDAPQTAVLVGDGFSSMVVLGNGDVTITATATGPGGTATDAVEATYPYVPLTTNQAASTVVGWPAFDTPSADVASPSPSRAPPAAPGSTATAWWSPTSRRRRRWRSSPFPRNRARRRRGSSGPTTATAVP
jgi:hypothetical protein